MENRQEIQHRRRREGLEHLKGKLLHGPGLAQSGLDDPEVGALDEGPLDQAIQQGITQGLPPLGGQCGPATGGGVGIWQALGGGHIGRTHGAARQEKQKKEGQAKEELSHG